MISTLLAGGLIGAGTAGALAFVPSLVFGHVINGLDGKRMPWEDNSLKHALSLMCAASGIGFAVGSASSVLQIASGFIADGIVAACTSMAHTISAGAVYAFSAICSSSLTTSAQVLLASTIGIAAPPAAIVVGAAVATALAITAAFAIGKSISNSISDR